MAESKVWSAPGVRVLVTGVVLVLGAIVLLVLAMVSNLLVVLCGEQATQQVNSGSLYQ
jgi:hypothetical protein